jgi:hypothetical protein
MVRVNVINIVFSLAPFEKKNVNVPIFGGKHDKFSGGVFWGSRNPSKGNCSTRRVLP